MNREQKRSLGKKASADIDYLNTPCTLTEAVQIARGVAEDVIADYNNQQRHLQVAMSLQLEVIKEIIISSGLITEEKFREKYMERVDDFNQRQKEAYKKSEESEVEDAPVMSAKPVGNIEIIKE